MATASVRRGLLDLPTPNLRGDFDRLAPHIVRALEHASATHELADVWDAIENGKAQLWPGVDSVVVTEVVETPRSKSLHWWLAGGNLTELKAMEPGIEAWGRSQGCTRMTLAGRKGWSRSWSTRDWMETLTVMEKRLQ